MTLLPASDRNLSEGFATYCRQPFFFPLIGAVLSEKQQGIVFADSARFPKNWYVEHKFGFAQIFGGSSNEFYDDLQRYLFIEKKFNAVKVRLYGTDAPTFLQQAKCLLSERQRFILDRALFERKIKAQIKNNSLSFLEVSSNNIEVIEKHFGVTTRFWSNSEDFIKYGRSVVALLNGSVAAICYAAAEVKSNLEIDVFTLPVFRGKGIAHATVIEFLNRSLRDGFEPLWDCFTNNVSSLALCNSVGFIPEGKPYPFFTIEK
jgi:RimJ/RimL family protein N-acetyltransferase